MIIICVCVYVDLYEIGKLFNVHVSVSFLLLLPTPEHNNVFSCSQTLKIQHPPTPQVSYKQ